jgi:hypothetical protein
LDENAEVKEKSGLIIVKSIEKINNISLTQKITLHGEQMIISIKDVLFITGVNEGLNDSIL